MKLFSNAVLHMSGVVTGERLKEHKHPTAGVYCCCTTCLSLVYGEIWLEAVADYPTVIKGPVSKISIMVCLLNINVPHDLCLSLFRKMQLLWALFPPQGERKKKQKTCDCLILVTHVMTCLLKLEADIKQLSFMSVQSGSQPFLNDRV